MWTKLWKTGVMVLMLVASLAGCATGHYTPLGEAEKTEIAQLKENVYRVEYRVSAFTSQEQLDFYLRRRCAELTLREGYDFFHLARRADVLGLSRRTAMTVTLYKGQKPVGVADLYDAKDVLAETPTKRTSEKAGSLPAHGFAATARVESIWTGAPGQQPVAHGGEIRLCRGTGMPTASLSTYRSTMSSTRERPCQKFTD
jgi:hypothetical protein